jgi:DNA modification methylase
VLDLFGGSGSALIPAHKTGRRCYVAEIDPIYCDRIIRRWEAYSKDVAERMLAGFHFNHRSRRPHDENTIRHPRRFFPPSLILQQTTR